MSSAKTPPEPALVVWKRGKPYRWSNDGAKNKNAAEMVRKYVFLTRGSTWHKAQSLLSVLVVNLQEWSEVSSFDFLEWFSAEYRTASSPPKWQAAHKIHVRSDHLPICSEFSADDAVARSHRRQDVFLPKNSSLFF